jgi:hypothetical protein
MVVVMVNHILVVIDGSHQQGAGGTVVHSHLLDMQDHLMLAESSRRRRRAFNNFGQQRKYVNIDDLGDS